MEATQDNWRTNFILTVSVIVTVALRGAQMGIQGISKYH
jgi:hypothetical protein